MKYWLKKCPRCSGDLREELNTLVACLQCGYTLTHAQEAALITSGVIEGQLVRAEEPQHRAAHAGRRRPVG